MHTYTIVSHGVVLNVCYTQAFCDKVLLTNDVPRTYKYLQMLCLPFSPVMQPCSEGMVLSRDSARKTEG